MVTRTRTRKDRVQKNAEVYHESDIDIILILSRRLARRVVVVVAGGLVAKSTGTFCVYSVTATGYQCDGDADDADAKKEVLFVNTKILCQSNDGGTSSVVSSDSGCRGEKYRYFFLCVTDGLIHD